MVDRAIAALLKDLKARGMLDDTLVLWGGEFGRTPLAQFSDGRDHNPYGFTMWMPGGGVKCGTIYGAADDFGYHAVQDRMHIHDLHASAPAGDIGPRPSFTQCSRIAEIKQSHRTWQIGPSNGQIDRSSLKRCQVDPSPCAGGVFHASVRLRRAAHRQVDGIVDRQQPIAHLFGVQPPPVEVREQL